MKRKRSRRYYAVRFSIELWKCFECIVNDIPKTIMTFKAAITDFKPKSMSPML